jgi:hypothetical protein
MDKVCPTGGGIPGDDLSSSPDVRPTYTDLRLVKFEYPARPIQPKAIVSQPVDLVFIEKEDGCELLAEDGNLIFV